MWGKSIASIHYKLAEYAGNGKRMFACSSFQTHSIPLLHILSQYDQNMPVYFLDTGYHFPETKLFRDQIVQMLGLNLRIIQSSVDKIAEVLTGAINGNYPPGLYNAVEHNFTVNEIADYVRSLYPGVESIHVSFNVPLQRIITEIPCKIFSHMTLQSVSFEDELTQFNSHFSF